MWLPEYSNDELVERRAIRRLIHGWIESESSILEVTGAPGAGKSVLLYQFYKSYSSTLHTSFGHQDRSQLAAVHFCSRVRSATLDPLLFIQSIIDQLSDSLPGFAAAAVEASRKAARDSSTTIVGTANAEVVHPGGQAIGVVVSLSGKSALELVNQVLRPALETCIGKYWPIVLVDGVDEALDYPSAVTIPALLRGQAMRSLPLRLILSSRTGPRETLERSRKIEIDLQSLSEDDIYSYARPRLAGHDGFPSDQAEEAARSIVAASGGNFLYARYATKEPLSMSKGSLPLGLTEWYERFVSALGPYGTAGEVLSRWRKQLRPVLSALVAAQGEGLSKAQIKAAADIDTEHLTDALDDLRDYIIGSEATTFRLYHGSFANFLCARYLGHPPLIDEELAHLRVVRALLSSTPDPREPGEDNWSRADKYALSYLAHHAARCGRLEPLLYDASFLVNTEPYGLLSAIQSMVPIPKIAYIYLRAFPHLVDAGTSARASQLEAAAKSLSPNELLQPLESLKVSRDWSLQWSVESVSQQQFLLFGHDSAVTALDSMCEADEETLLASGDSDGMIYIWKPLTSEVMQKINAHDDTVTCLLFVRSSSGQVTLVSGSLDGRIAVWDPYSGRLLGRLSTSLEADEHNQERRKFSTSKGQTILFVSELGSPIRDNAAHLWAVNALCPVVVDGTIRVLSAGGDSVIRLWDLETRDLVAEFPGSPQEVVEISAAIIPSDTNTTSFFASASHKFVTVWNLESRRAVDTFEYPSSVSAVKLAYVDSRLLLLTPGDDCAIEARDVETGTVTRRLGGPGATAIALLDEQGLGVATASSDGVVRLWLHQSEMAELVGHRGSVVSLTTISTPRGVLIVSGGNDKTIRLWELAPIADGSTPNVVGLPLTAVQFGSLRDRDLVLCGSNVGPTSLRSATDGTEIYRLLGQLEAVRSVDLLTADDDTYVSIGCADGGLSVWSLDRRVELYRIQSSGGGVCCLGIVSASPALVYVDADVTRLVDLLSGREVGEVAHDGGPVLSARVVGSRVVLVDGGAVRVWEQESNTLTRYASDLSDSVFSVSTVSDDWAVTIGLASGKIAMMRPRGIEDVGDHAPDIRFVASRETSSGVIVASSSGRTVRVSRVGDYQKVVSIPLSAEVRSIAVGYSGVVAIGSDDGVRSVRLRADLAIEDEQRLGFGGQDDRTAEKPIVLGSDSRSLDGYEQFEGAKTSDVIRRVIQSAYSVNMSTGAREFFEWSAGQAAEKYGPEHPKVADRYSRLAYEHYRAGDLATAHRVMQESIRIYEIALGPKHVTVGTQLLRFSEILFSEEELALAQEVLVRALEIFEEAYGPSHDLVADVLEKLGDAHSALGSHSEAIDLYTRILGILESRENRLGVWSAIFSRLGNERISLSQYDEARSLFARWLAMASDGENPDQEQMLSAMEWLAYVLRLEGKFEEARVTMETALEMSVALHGEDEPRHLPWLGELCQLASAMNDAQAERDFHASWIRLADVIGMSSHPDYLRHRFGLARASLDLGVPEEAAREFRLSASLAEAEHGTDILHAASLNGLGVALVATGRKADARLPFEQALELLRAQENPDETAVGLARQVALNLDDASSDTVVRPDGDLTEDR